MAATQLAVEKLSQSSGEMQIEMISLQNEEPPRKTNETPRGSRFWIVFVIICTVSFIAALESTIITTSLPLISEAVDSSNGNYVWIASSFLFTSTVFQPLYGQVSNIFGRRIPYLFSLSLFIFGAGLCGGASNFPMMIAGRTIQGIGSAGMFVLSDLIICDLIPLRERAKYMGGVLSMAALGTVLGPIVGGALTTANWRWCFWISLPIGIPCIGLMTLCLRLKYKREARWGNALGRVDVLGNAIFIPSVLAILLGLVLGGSTFAWSSWHIIVPIVLGVVGWIFFHIHQASRICKEPSIPPRLFNNRTTLAALLLTFLAGVLFTWVIYFMPFYFQALRNATPMLSGVYVIPLFICLILSSGFAGGMLSKFGKYKVMHMIGFGVMSIGFGLASTLSSTSNNAVWIFAQIFLSIGLGTTMTTLLPAVLAALDEADVATATATFSFSRSFGMVWGITLPAIVFNNAFDDNSASIFINSPDLQSKLSNGMAYEFVIWGGVHDLQGVFRQEVLKAYTISLRHVWYAGLAFSLLACVIVMIEKQIELRKELDTDFGLDTGHVSAEEIPGGKDTKLGDSGRSDASQV